MTSREKLSKGERGNVANIEIAPWIDVAIERGDVTPDLFCVEPVLRRPLQHQIRWQDVFVVLDVCRSSNHGCSACQVTRLTEKLAGKDVQTAKRGGVPLKVIPIESDAAVGAPWNRQRLAGIVFRADACFKDIHDNHECLAWSRLRRLTARRDGKSDGDGRRAQRTADHGFVLECRRIARSCQHQLLTSQ